jgi:hypothetical protein
MQDTQPYLAFLWACKKPHGKVFLSIGCRMLKSMPLHLAQKTMSSPVKSMACTSSYPSMTSTGGPSMHGDMQRRLMPKLAQHASQPRGGTAPNTFEMCIERCILVFQKIF